MYVGRVETDWPQHGLSENYIFSEGKPTRFKAIKKNGKFISIVGDRYKLLPNEEAVRMAEEVATLVGAVPFDKFKGDWFKRTAGNSFLTGHNLAQMHALYAFNAPEDIGGGDMVQFGFAVHNSIDGSMAFQIAGFTFRPACENTTFMGIRGMSGTVLSSVYQRHTRHMETRKEKLTDAMLSVIAQSKVVLARYKGMTEIQLELEMAERLVKAMPKKYIPDYIFVDQDKKIDRVKLLEAPMLWDTYNDFTGAIWHNQKTDYTAKQELFDKLHRVVLTPTQ